MAGVGPCRNYVYVCPVCGSVTGGATEGGLLRDCRVCPFKGMCSLRDLQDLPQVEHICSDDCLLARIFGASKLYLKVGKPG
jgi:hypothetical protein